MLHTWTRDLRYHPHVHLLVSAGGLDFTRELWHRARNHTLVHVKPLMLIFRAKLRDGLKKLGLYQQVKGGAWTKPWSVYSKAVGYGEQAFEYMADYLFRVGISNQRIVQCADGKVTFWYKESKSKRRMTVTLPVFEFIDRFLMHVLPQGFVKVRYYGIYAPGSRAKLALVRELLGADVRAKSADPAQGVAGSQDKADNDGEAWRPRCPTCQRPMTLSGTLVKYAREPPG